MNRLLEIQSIFTPPGQLAALGMVHKFISCDCQLNAKQHSVLVLDLFTSTCSEVCKYMEQASCQNPVISDSDDSGNEEYAYKARKN